MKEKLQTNMKEALKARDKIKLDTIRSILTALQYEEMQKKVDQLPDEATIDILKKETKKRQEELEFATKANRQDLIDKLKREVQIIEEYLPQQLSEPELHKLITEMKVADPAISMGGVMKILKERVAGQYDGKLASKLAKEILG